MKTSSTLAAPWTTFVLLLLLIPAAPANAEEGLSFSLGLIDFTRDLEAFEAGVEYRFEAIPGGMVPTLGLLATEDEALYVYVGVRRPFNLGSSPWDLVPSVAMSFYEKGDGQDLGNVIEFRSGLDIVRRFESGRAIGVGFYHLSNASISDTNPGTNSLLFRIEFP